MRFWRLSWISRSSRLRERYIRRYICTRVVRSRPWYRADSCTPVRTCVVWVLMRRPRRRNLRGHYTRTAGGSATGAPVAPGQLPIQSRHGVEHPHEPAPERRQPVLHARRYLRIDLPTEDAEANELSQALVQYFFAEARNAPLQRARTADAEPHRLQDAQRPLTPQHLFHHSARWRGKHRQRCELLHSWKFTPFGSLVTKKCLLAPFSPAASMLRR